MSLTIQLVQILITASSVLFMATGAVVLFLIAFQATYYERLNRTRKRDGTIHFKGKSYYMVKDDDFLAMKRYIEFLEKVNATHKRKC